MAYLLQGYEEKIQFFTFFFFINRKNIVIHLNIEALLLVSTFQLKSRDGPVINTKLNVSIYFKESILRIHVHTIFLWSVKSIVYNWKTAKDHHA